MGLPHWFSAKESTYNAGDMGLIPGKISWKRAWQPTSVLSPGESHGVRSLAGYSPWGQKESDMIEATEHALICHMNIPQFVYPSLTILWLADI